MSELNTQWLEALSKSGGPQEALAAIGAHFQSDSGTLHRIGADGQLHLLAVLGKFPPPVMDAIRTIPVGKGLAGLAAERRVPVTVCNLQTDTTGDVRPGARATGMEGAITVPIFAECGERVIGVLGVANLNPREYSPVEIASLLVCARAIGAFI